MECDGTASAYRRHVRLGEPKHEACRRAHAQAWSSWRHLHPEYDWAAKLERRRLREAMSHHVGVCLETGIVVYANREDENLAAVIKTMRRINRKLEVQALPDPLDIEKIAVWARDNLDQVCRMPLECHHA